MLRTKTEQRMIRTSARTPPGQSYSDTESDGTDDTVEEIFKQKQKRDQFDNTDGFPQSKTKGLAKFNLLNNNSSVDEC